MSRLARLRATQRYYASQWPSLASRSDSYASQSPPLLRSGSKDFGGLRFYARAVKKLLSIPKLLAASAAEKPATAKDSNVHQEAAPVKSRTKSRPFKSKAQAMPPILVDLNKFSLMDWAEAERGKLAEEIRSAKERSRARKKEREAKIESPTSPLTRTKLKPKKPFPWFSRRIEGVITQPTEPRTVLEDVPSEKAPIAKLAHGLDRVLFNPGVHWFQDPRSRVYNFPPEIQKIPEVKNFAFERLPPYIRSSGDNELHRLAQQEQRRFAGSTSSLTGFLSHIYFLIGGFMFVDLKTLGTAFSTEPRTFTPGQRAPVTLSFKHRDGVYLIDRISFDPDNNALNILSWQGTLLEKFLTHSPAEFAPLMRSNPTPENGKDISQRKEAYRYSKSDSFLMRAQLDCYDDRLPGTGVFDLKTRAALPIRMDMLNYKENAAYHLRTLHGHLESFEREYYDLIRSAFLKYSFQARIGNMDGVLVAYHNTERLFGFQYVPLEDMDARLFGGEDRGARVFEKCIKLMEIVSEEIVGAFPGQSVRCTVETDEKKRTMQLFITPDGDEAEEENPLKDLITDQHATAGDEKLKPIVLVNIRVNHFLGNDHVTPFKAISETEEPWTMQWSIERSSSKDSAIWKQLAAVRKRQSFPYSLPTGVGLEDIADLWQSMALTPDMSMAGIPPSLQGRLSEFFRNPSSLVRRLRELARQRAEELKEVQAKENAKEKVVWRQIAPAQDEAADA